LKEVIKFYWTATPEQKKKLEFSIKLGTLSGKAVTIVENAGPGCSGHSPKYHTNWFGSSVFIFHAKAVGNFREKVMAPFLKVRIAQYKVHLRRNLTLKLTKLSC
jgi:hypothetical protein